MSKRNLACSIGIIVLLVVAYVIAYLYQPTSVQARIQGLHPIGIGIVVVVMGFLFKRRGNYVTRLDAWKSEVLHFAQDLEQYIDGNDLNGRGYSDGDRQAYGRFVSRWGSLITSLKTVCPPSVVKEFIVTDGESPLLEDLHKLATLAAGQVDEARRLISVIKHRDIRSLHKKIERLYL